MSTGMRKWMEKDCPEIEYLPAQVLIDREELKQLRADLEKHKAERDALRSKIEEMEKQEPAGTLHDDGYFVWRKTAPYQSNYAGWKMALYALPGAKGEEK